MIVHFISRVLSATVLLSLWLTSSVAQETRYFSERPVAVAFSRGFSIYDQAEYGAALYRRLRVGRVMLRDVVRKPIVRPSPESRVSLSGTLVYLLSGKGTARDTISFELVRDQAHAELRLKEHKKRMGVKARIERTDGQTRVVRSWVTQHRLQEGDPVPDLADSFEPGVTRKRVLVERFGSRFVRKTTTIFGLFRYENGVLFESAHPELYTKQLPSADEIEAMVASAGDVGIVYLPQQVEYAGRNRIRDQLEAVHGTILQQRQNEDPDSWRVRRAVGSWWLTLKKAMVDEVESHTVTGFVARDSSPYRGEVRLRPRRNSDLERDVVLVTSERSRFAPVVSEPAVATIHACAGLPDGAKAVVHAVAGALNAKVDAQYSQSATRDAAWSLVDVLDRVAERGKIDAFVQFTRFDDTGPVMYGSVHVGTGHWLPDALDEVLQSELRSFEGWHIEHTERDDRSFLHVFREQRPEVPDLISDFWLAFDDGCLWFSAGQENAHEAIRISVEKCQNHASPQRSIPALTVQFDVRRWLSWSEQDSSRLALLPQWLDEHDPTTAFHSLLGSGEEARAVTPLFARAFDGREGEGLKLTLGRDGADLLLWVEIEPALIDYCFGRYLDLWEDEAREARDYRRSMEEKIERSTLRTLEKLDHIWDER